MIDTNANLELVTLYEQGGLSIQEIADDTGYEVSAIKSVLLQGSKKYRVDCKLEAKEIELGVTRTNGSETTCHITDEEDRELIEMAKDIARNSDNDLVRTRMIIYLHDEKKGRNDRDLKSGNVNAHILILNEAFKRAREHKLKSNGEGSIIDI